MYSLRRILSVVPAVFFGAVSSALATTYTPLISSDMFDGVRTDVNTAAAGIISVLIIIVGVALLVKVLH